VIPDWLVLLLLVLALAVILRRIVKEERAANRYRGDAGR
jgi:hypothetical protein